MTVEQLFCYCCFFYLGGLLSVVSVTSNVLKVASGTLCTEIWDIKWILTDKQILGIKVAVGQCGGLVRKRHSNTMGGTPSQHPQMQDF